MSLTSCNVLGEMSCLMLHADRRPRILLIIPAFNESGVIGRVVEGARAQLGEGQAILVVDDGSSDGTAEEARRAGAWVVSLVRNLGYGYALQTGYRVAIDRGFEVAVQMDGDGQHDPASIPALLEPIFSGRADLVLGSRALSDVHYPMPWARRLGQRLFSWILRRMCGLMVRDPTSGFQAIGPQALRLLATEDFPGDYPDTDVLLYLHLNGRRVVEVPANFRVNERGKSMHNGLTRAAYYVYKMLFSMVLVYLRHPRGRRADGPQNGTNAAHDEPSNASAATGRAGVGADRRDLGLSARAATKS